MNILLVLLGPTGVGKTEWSLDVAEKLSSPVLSADSRQIYKGMSICTAAPTKDQMLRVPHHFVEILSPEEYYSASIFEQDAVTLLQEIHKQHEVAIMTGGFYDVFRCRF